MGVARVKASMDKISDFTNLFLFIAKTTLLETLSYNNGNIKP